MQSTILVCIFVNIFDQAALLCPTFAFIHDPGNEVYRKIVHGYKHDYQKATRHNKKTLLARQVLRRLDPKARFLKKSRHGDGWSVMNERDALKKIKQALREKDEWSQVSKEFKRKLMQYIYLMTN